MVPGGSPVCRAPIDTEGAVSKCDEEEEEEGSPPRPTPGEQGMSHWGPAGRLAPHQSSVSQSSCVSCREVWS